MLIRRVVGTSMLPGLKPGQLIVAFKKRQPSEDSIVIVSYNGKELIKRLSKISKDKIYILGDNADYSTDSKSYGWLDKKHILATVIWPKNN